MATTLTILVFALLITGVATATVYALPVIQQANAVQTQNGDLTHSQSRLRQRDCSQNGEIIQLQQRLQLRYCGQNCECISDQRGSETANEEIYQYQFCEQNCLLTQNRNKFGAVE